MPIKSKPSTSKSPADLWTLLTSESGTPATDSFNSSCGVAVNEYFWLNSLHPTYPMHEVLAQGVAQQLAAGPNVC